MSCSTSPGLFLFWVFNPPFPTPQTHPQLHNLTFLNLPTLFTSLENHHLVIPTTYTRYHKMKFFALLPLLLTFATSAFATSSSLTRKHNDVIQARQAKISKGFTADVCANLDLDLTLPMVLRDGTSSLSRRLSYHLLIPNCNYQQASPSTLVTSTSVFVYHSLQSSSGPTQSVNWPLF